MQRDFHHGLLGLRAMCGWLGPGYTPNWVR